MNDGVDHSMTDKTVAGEEMSDRVGRQETGAHRPERDLQAQPQGVDLDLAEGEHHGARRKPWRANTAAAAGPRKNASAARVAGLSVKRRRG